MSLSEFDLELADELSRYRDDPYGFVLFAFDWESAELREFGGPDDWQRMFLDGVGAEVKHRGFDGSTAVDAVRFATSSGHGIGKSAITAWIILWVMSTRPNCKGVVTANTGEQLKTKTWAEVGKWLKLCITEPWFVYANTRGNMSMHHRMNKETWRVDAQTCRDENSEAFAGLHAAGSSPFYIYDEASAVPDKIWEVSEGGLTDGEPFWFVFGNPTRNTGRFFECFHQHRHRWTTRKIDSRTVRITNKKLLNQWVEDYGEDSDFVRVRVRGEFPRAASTQFIDRDRVETAMLRKAADDPGAALVMSIDVARFGDDQSCIVFRQGRDAKGIPWETFRGLDTMELSSRAAALYTKYRPDAVFVDGGGVGGGVVDRLRQLGVPAIEVMFGALAHESRRYMNRRSEMWDRMREWLLDGSIPQDKEMRDALTSIEYGHDGKNRLQLESKKDMKRRGLPSPDQADALALTFAEVVVRRDMRGGREGRQQVAEMEYDVWGY